MEGRCVGLARSLQGRSPGHFPSFNKSKPGNTNPNARLTVCYTLEEDDQSHGHSTSPFDDDARAAIRSRSARSLIALPLPGRGCGSFRQRAQHGFAGRGSWLATGPENCLLLLRSTGWMRRRREMMPGGETPTPRRGRISGREMLARRKTSAATLRKRGGGVSESRRGPPCNLHMVSCREFFSAV